jgi:phosphopantothenoylcysteine decarboxylase/phosphopantothenate--cysteine ligase
MKQKKILLIITGSIAAYKAMDLLRLLQKKSYEVTCVLTKSACEFITPLLASSLSGKKTYTDLFSTDDEIEMGHIQLSRSSDLIVVAPATADFIAKIANGFADDLASNVILAANKKIILAPAMNEKMWENKQTQKNLVKVLESGIACVEPEKDILACGELGIGKMAAPEKICEKICDFFARQNQLQGKKILITGGATFEQIDPVRFIGNHSSGKQSIEIAKVLHEMGADVTLIAGNIREVIQLPKEKIIRVKTAQEMFDAVKNIVTSFSSSLERSSEDLVSLNSKAKLLRSSAFQAKDDGRGVDIFIGCAAVSDFKVAKISQQKIKKTAAKNLTLELEKNPDILEFVGTSKQRPTLVIGFAAESQNLEKHAREKLQKKNCDLIIANDIESGKIFGSDETKAIFVSKNKTENLGKISKEKLAELLAAKITKFFC